MARKHKIEMADYSVIIEIAEDDSVALDVQAHRTSPRTWARRC